MTNLKLRPKSKIQDIMILRQTALSVFVERGIFRVSRDNLSSSTVEVIGKPIFARITDLKFVEKMGKKIVSKLEV